MDQWGNPLQHVYLLWGEGKRKDRFCGKCRLNFKHTFITIIIINLLNNIVPQIKLKVRRGSLLFTMKTDGGKEKISRSFHVFFSGVNFVSEQTQLCTERLHSNCITQLLIWILLYLCPELKSPQRCELSAGPSAFSSCWATCEVETTSRSSSRKSSAVCC